MYQKNLIQSISELTCVTSQSIGHISSTQRLRPPRVDHEEAPAKPPPTGQLDLLGDRIDRDDLALNKARVGVLDHLVEVGRAGQDRRGRGDPSRSRETGGLGLGLTLVERIVEGHGGTVGVTSRAGAGATFWIQLPMVG